MAITSNPIIGKTTGQYAGAIFYSMHGKNILRQKPENVKVSIYDLRG